MLKKLILKQTWPLIYQTKNSKTCLMQEQIHLIVLEGSQTTLQGCFAGQSDINSQISRIGSSFCQLQLFPPGINLHTGYCQVSTTYTLWSWLKQRLLSLAARLASLLNSQDTNFLTDNQNLATYTSMDLTKTVYLIGGWSHSLRTSSVTAEKRISRSSRSLGPKISQHIH